MGGIGVAEFHADATDGECCPGQQLLGPVSEDLALDVGIAGPGLFQPALQGPTRQTEAAGDPVDGRP